jgi:hypothetical protein
MERRDVGRCGSGPELGASARIAGPVGEAGELAADLARGTDRDARHPELGCEDDQDPIADDVRGLRVVAPVALDRRSRDPRGVLAVMFGHLFLAPGSPDRTMRRIDVTTVSIRGLIQASIWGVDPGGALTCRLPADGSLEGEDVVSDQMSMTQAPL